MEHDNGFYMARDNWKYHLQFDWEGCGFRKGNPLIVVTRTDSKVIFMSENGKFWRLYVQQTKNYGVNLSESRNETFEDCIILEEVKRIHNINYKYVSSKDDIVLTYNQLLMGYPPLPIKSDEQFWGTQDRIDALIDKGELTEAEQDYLSVLGMLIERYESDNEPNITPRIKGN